MSTTRRSGGRAARRLERADGAGTGPTEAIWPGISGGQYKALTDAELAMIDDTAMRILEEIGLKGATQTCIDTICAAGGSLTEDGRLLMPEPMVRAVLKIAGRGFKLYGQQAQHDIDPSGSRIHFGTSGAAVHIVDSETSEIRDSTLRDLYDMARLANALPNLHMFQRTVVARDITDPREMDINTAYACLAGTAKPTGTSFGSPEVMEETVGMLRILMGGAEALRARPPICVSTCFIVPPLTFAEEALGVIECAARHGIPLKLVSAGQAGATSPAPLAGAVAQQTAEVLAGLVYVNLLNPGHPATFGALPFVSDLRTGAMSGGSAEQGLLMAACAQMARFYDIPCAVSAGMTDSKLPDFQAGYEKGYTELLSALAGANLVYEAAGMYGSLLGCSFESFVLDNDMIGSIMRATRGFEVNERTLALETIRDVCVGGPGHFLGHQQTLNRMQSDYYYPALADRRTPQEWAAAEDKDLLERARARTRELLAAPPPPHIAPDIDADIRAHYPIRLARP
ncbi:trimethylamine methyltransferase family protein [Shimia sp. CNT1-13L.2]|uniref:trimethylamine methyltransferase family protein n=1 Tax=Shimia sp. CNT1-13L.2 TaxID=2959663 RepID=UPI0020CD7348|nr:trimethylamine methyltransferase family protein [Shimia sp. CNT1-13L.2]MCP9481117.1 trimethylamine methyltransferase family protein [Shimia sp. CNT1-13L.2]